MKTTLTFVCIMLCALFLVGCQQEFDAPTTPPQAPGDVPTEQNVQGDATVGGAIVLPQEAPWAWHGEDQLSMAQDAFILTSSEMSTQVTLDNSYVYNQYYIYNEQTGWTSLMIDENAGNTYLSNYHNFTLEITENMLGENVLAVYLCKGSVTLSDGSRVDYCPERDVNQWQVEKFTVEMAGTEIELSIESDNALPGEYTLSLLVDVNQNNLPTDEIVVSIETTMFTEGVSSSSVSGNTPSTTTSIIDKTTQFPNGLTGDAMIEFTGMVQEGTFDITASWENTVTGETGQVSKTVYIGVDAPSTLPIGPGQVSTDTGSYPEYLIEENIGQYTYQSSDRQENPFAYKNSSFESNFYSAQYSHDSSASIYVMENVEGRDYVMQELFEEAIQIDPNMRLDEGVHGDNNIYYIEENSNSENVYLFWHSGNNVIIIGHENIVTLSDDLVDAYLDKYPSDVETATLAGNEDISLSYDINGDGSVESNDATMLSRYMFGLSGANLIEGLETINNAATVQSKIENLEASGALDVDGNSEISPYTDSFLLSRAITGLRGNELTDGVVGTNATRTTSAQIMAFLAVQ